MIIIVIIIESSVYLLLKPLYVYRDGTGLDTETAT